VHSPASASEQSLSTLELIHAPHPPYPFPPSPTAKHRRPGTVHYGLAPRRNSTSYRALGRAAVTVVRQRQRQRQRHSCVRTTPLVPGRLSRASTQRHNRASSTRCPLASGRIRRCPLTARRRPLTARRHAYTAQSCSARAVYGTGERVALQPAASLASFIGRQAWRVLGMCERLAAAYFADRPRRAARHIRLPCSKWQQRRYRPSAHNPSPSVSNDSRYPKHARRDRVDRSAASARQSSPLTCTDGKHPSLSATPPSPISSA
jgi:hypothetical protein